ncbi:MAG: NAD(+) synthase [Clostridium sp.]
MGFIKVSTACPVTSVSDVEFNVKKIKDCISIAINDKSKFIQFPELAITSYSCGDLFLNNRLIEKSNEAIKELCDFSKNKDILISVGAPLLHNTSLYNCLFLILNGTILGIVPKSYIPNYSEFYEKRWFTPGLNLENRYINFDTYKDIPFGTKFIFSSGLAKFGFEVCEDLWTTIPPSSYLSLAGANIIGNGSASNELVSKADYRRSIVNGQSARALSAYVYSSAGVYESTTDVLFSGHLIISENGSTVIENNRFQRENEVLSTVIDLDRLNSERLKNISFRDASFNLLNFKEINFSFITEDIGEFNRTITKHPFVPYNENNRDVTCKEIFNIQSAALAKRIEYTGVKKVVLGISGGLDSTLALLVVIKTFKLLNFPMKNIVTITMPGFGTTDRTYDNALNLCKLLKTDLREINIVASALQHFKDIGHDKKVHDVTYENVQARERTQILMDIANKEGGLSIGTGDLSEIALGWSTYNGDHMSMYSVNCSIPKTLIRYLVKYVADKEVDSNVAHILMDILDTPVSPELLPKDSNGNITQITEDIVGPYELHDFFLYHFMKQGATKEKLLYLTKVAFKNDYSEEVIAKWLDKFIKRFFTQQFKRSALPDGPKVGTIALSPRGDLRMPSDASFNSFI